MSVVSRVALRGSVKHGIARLRASAAENPSTCKENKPLITRLTRVAHKAPTRLVPLGKSSVESAGAAICALSNYGAGMLQGDSAELSVHVEQGARLGIMTQGASRIYTQRVSNECKADLHATVEKDGILVFAPDPCAMFASSSYSQTQVFRIHPESSVALIDWFSSGRYMNDERWKFDKLYTRTSLKWLEHENENGSDDDDSVPFLQDSISMDLRLDSSNGRDDPHAVSDFNCFASLILYGKHIKAIHERCESLADQFAARHTRVRDRVGIYPCDSTDEDKKTQSESLGLSGRVVMGSSRVLLEGKPSDAYVIRFAAKTNEDMYRVFHDVLRPLAPSFGLEFYKERIRAQRSEILRKDPAQPKVDGMTIQTPNRIRKPPLEEFFPLFPPTVARNSTSDANFWSIAMLADSSLPTGSFAHSAGLEAAGQLGMIKGEKDVLTFVQAATRSSMQLLTPFLISGHRISQGGPLFELSKIQEKWNKLNQQAQAVMVTNEPACAASLDQGKSLARIASQWLRTESNLTSQYQNSQMVEKILECLKSNPPHIAPALGVIGGIMGLDEIQVCRLFAYCMARDLVSAAVRLSLVGPLASVPLLHKVRESAEDGMRVVLLSMKEHPDDPLMSAAASAPVIEALHPCHEILQVRLFRS